MKWALNWVNRLARQLGRRYIPHLMEYLCIAMLGVYILNYLPGLRSPEGLLAFDRDLILHGEIWRVITFVFLPPPGGIGGIVAVLIQLYFFYFIGNALENQWGGARFNVYYGLGVLCAILCGFITGYTDNYFLNMTVLLAFATLYPEMEVNLFYVLPVKMKWIGLAWAAYMIYLCIAGAGWLRVLLSLAPYLALFGPQAFALLRTDVKRLFR